MNQLYLIVTGLLLTGQVSAGKNIQDELVQAIKESNVRKVYRIVQNDTSICSVRNLSRAFESIKQDKNNPKKQRLYLLMLMCTQKYKKQDIINAFNKEETS